MSIGDSERWFSDFTGEEADDHQRVQFDVPEIVAKVGRVHAIAYVATRDGKTELYEHEFQEHNAPMLCVSDDGRQLMIIGGEYEVTEYGIED